MSTLNVDKVDPNTGTALEIGSSGDTVTIPSGATLTLTSATLNLPTTITSTTEVKTNKISPATGVAFAMGDSGDTFTVPSGATIVNSGTATGFGITAASFSPLAQPVIINGDMAISQRSTSVAGVDASENCQTVDRWSQWLSAAGTWTNTQEAMSVADYNTTGFKKAWKWDCTTADASLAVNAYFQISYRIEGNTVQMFKKGTTTAEAYTLAFWVKSTKTGTFIAELNDVTNERIISVAYTVDTTDTWEKKVLNFIADTNGETIADSNARGMAIYFTVAVGTNFTSGTLNTIWNDDSGITANRCVGQVNAADSTSNNFHLTGVQLEVGTYTADTIPPFRHESYADNLRRCQRYFYKPTSKFANAGKSYSLTSIDMEITCTVDFPTQMRTAPALVVGTNNMRDDSDVGVTANVSDLSTDGHKYGMKKTGSSNEHYGISFYGQTYDAEFNF